MRWKSEHARQQANDVCGSLDIVEIEKVTKEIINVARAARERERAKKHTRKEEIVFFLFTISQGRLEVSFFIENIPFGEYMDGWVSQAHSDAHTYTPHITGNSTHFNRFSESIM